MNIDATPRNRRKRLLTRVISIFVLVSTVFLVACGEASKTGGQCTRNDECPEGQRCTNEQVCVVAECDTNDQCRQNNIRLICSDQFRCELKPGFGDECDLDRPCAFGQFCSTLLGRCFESSASKDCTRRGQCPAGQTCDRSVNKCVDDFGCLSNDFCEPDETCDIVNGVCRSSASECTSCILPSSTCPSGTTCDPETKECTTEAVAPACRRDERCDPLGRCIQCATTSECGPGLFCNAAIGRCESNTQCVDDPSLCPDSSEVTCVLCSAPTVCDQRTKTCRAPAQTCESEVECPNEQTCDKSVDPPICVPRVPECLNDVLDEPRNDTIAAARPLEGLVYDDLRICQGDVDWYRIEVDAGTRLTVDARFSHRDGDIELQLFLLDGVSLIRQSRSATDNERVELEVGTDLVLLLRVFLAVPTPDPVPYRLILAESAAERCEDDVHEPDDVAADARELQSDTSYEGRVCSADPDWFVVKNVPAGSRLDARLDFVDNLGNLDLALYQSGGARAIAASTSQEDDERIVYDTPNAGDFFFRVSAEGADSNVYTFRVEVRANQDAVCQDDRFEPNEIEAPTPATPAATGNSGSLETDGLSICAGDEDWYLVQLLPEELLTTELTFLPDADLDLALYPSDVERATEPALRTSNGITGREWLAYRTFAQEDLLIRVFGQTRDAIAPYSLTIQTSTTVACQPDRFDRSALGNTAETAVQLGEPLPTEPVVGVDDLSLCVGDEDWFQVFVLVGFQNVLRVQFAEMDTRVDFELYDPSNLSEVLYDTYTAPTSDVHEVVISPPGTAGYGLLYLRVVSETPAPEYNIRLDVFGTACSADGAEPNDRPELAFNVTTATVSPSPLSDLTLCATSANPGDEDWFLVQPPSPGATIRASLAHQSGDLFLELRAPGAQARACNNLPPNRCYSDGPDRTEEVVFTATTTEPYYLRVGSIWSARTLPAPPPDANTRYDLRVELIAP